MSVSQLILWPGSCGVPDPCGSSNSISIPPVERYVDIALELMSNAFLKYLNARFLLIHQLISLFHLLVLTH